MTEGTESASRPFLRRKGGLWSIVGFALVVAIVVTFVVRQWGADDGEETPEAPAPRHLILISIDTLRADRLGAYGYQAGHTPVIDALAAEGVLFERHYTCYPLTLPAHLTQFTGVSGLGHRVRDNLYHTLPLELTTLAERLKANGFKTGAFVSAHTMKAGSGIERGFDIYDDKDVRELQPGRLTIAERKAPTTLKLAGDWIEARNSEGTERIFAFIHLFDPHVPYDPPADLKAEFNGSASRLYDGEIAFTDREIGVFLRRLKKLGLYEDALVVVTSDHGEGLGEHGELTHGYFCYDSTTHVPLIIRGAPELKKGTRVKGIVRNYDLAPTLLELLGIPDGAIRKQAHGVSLVRMMREPGFDLGLSAYVESHYAYLNAHWAKIRGLRRSDGLTLFSGSSIELYLDHAQTLNLADAETERVHQAREEIVRLMNSWIPPRTGSMAPRGDPYGSPYRGSPYRGSPYIGSPYPGESPVAQDFDPESLNDTFDLAAPASRVETLKDYQEAELAYDEERFASCAAILRNLVKTDPDFLMGHKLLATVDEGLVRSEHVQLGRKRARELTREAAESALKVAELSKLHGMTIAAKGAGRVAARLGAWLDDLALIERAGLGDDVVGWFHALVTYRLAEEKAPAAAAAQEFLKGAELGVSAGQAAKDLKSMQAGESIRLAPWE